MSVIYQIMNNITGDFYIGSTINFPKRKSTHLRNLRMGKHHSPILQRAWNKYGSSNFSFNILENVEPELNLLSRENYYIQKHRPKYNIAKDAKSPMLGRKHSEKTKQLMKQRPIVKGKNHYNYGKKASFDTIKKQIQSRLGRKHRPDTILKMKESGKKRKNIELFLAIENSKVYIHDNIGNVFHGYKQASVYHNIEISTICDILKRRHYKTRRGVTFYYSDFINLPFILEKKLDGLHRGISKSKNLYKVSYSTPFKNYSKTFKDYKDALTFLLEFYKLEYNMEYILE